MKPAVGNNIELFRMCRGQKTLNWIVSKPTRENSMPDKEFMYYIKNETSSEALYHIAVTCIERLAKMDKASAIKAILDSGTTSLLNMAKKNKS